MILNTRNEGGAFKSLFDFCDRVDQRAVNRRVLESFIKSGTFDSIEMLAEPWRTIAQFNPIFYLINGLRWTFTGTSDVPIALAFGLTVGFVVLCIAVVAVIFRTGWRLRG